MIDVTKFFSLDGYWGKMYGIISFIRLMYILPTNFTGEEKSILKKDRGEWYESGRLNQAV